MCQLIQYRLNRPTVAARCQFPVDAPHDARFGRSAKIIFRAVVTIHDGSDATRRNGCCGSHSIRRSLLRWGIVSECAVNSACFAPIWRSKYCRRVRPTVLRRSISTEAPASTTAVHFVVIRIRPRASIGQRWSQKCDPATFASRRTRGRAHVRLTQAQHLVHRNPGRAKASHYTLKFRSTACAEFSRFAACAACCADVVGLLLFGSSMSGRLPAP